MKKLLLILLTLVCMLCFTSATAQTFTYSEIGLQFNIPDKQYSLLTPDNLHLHPAWVSQQGATQDALSTQWREEGVLVTAVTLKDDIHIIVSAVKDDASVRLFDLDQQSADTRLNYKNSYAKNQVMQEEGYTFLDADWDNATARGRFLLTKYKLEKNDTSYSGYMYRTVRNGYEITLDYRVSGRTVKKTDLNALDTILDSLLFTKVLSKPATSVPAIVLTEAPPAETNTNKFTVAGTCEPGLTLTGVLMRMSSPEPIIVTATANKAGKFTMNYKLPEEGVWLMTLTVQSGDIVTEEIVFHTTTYKKSLLPVNLATVIPTVSYEDELVITGTTLQGVTVQCLSGDDFAKSVKTNSTGKFTFKLDTSEPGEYDIVLVFSKKKLDTRRFTYTFTRIVTDEQQIARWRDEAIKPAYETLKSKIKGYKGRTMVYSLYAVDTRYEDGEWLVRMAMTKKKDIYSNFVYVKTTEEPAFSIGDKVVMYGECLGTIEAELPDGKTETVPGFRLFFWD